MMTNKEVLDFIKNSNCNTVFDPFAGAGHLLNAVDGLGFTKKVGLDIDKNLGWEVNDSLISIPHIDEKTIIITNPPYLTNYSASRKKILDKVKKYFDKTLYDDLYLLSIDNMFFYSKIDITILDSEKENHSWKSPRNLILSALPTMFV